MEHIGEAIRHHRKARGLTQEELARRAGINPGSVVRLESGEVKNPRISTVFDLSDALGMDAQELLSYIMGPPTLAPNRETQPRAGSSTGERAATAVARRSYLTSPNGERIGVVLDMEEYRRILEDLEDLEALRAADQALAGIERGEEPVPWESVRDRIGSEYEAEGS